MSVSHVFIMEYDIDSAFDHPKFKAMETINAKLLALPDELDLKQSRYFMRLTRAFRNRRKEWIEETRPLAQNTFLEELTKL